MFSAENQDAIYRPHNLFIWFLLAFQGGLLNTGGFLAVHRFVSHITGYGTLLGENLAMGELQNAGGILLVPVFYLIGVMISAWFVERRRLRNRAPRYLVVFGLIIFNLILVTFAGINGYFGEFGEVFKYKRDFFLLFLLAYTCGLQNAVISSASGSVIRTTHLTGVTTDLGIGVIRMWTNRSHLDQKELFTLGCRLGIILSFVFGSIVGAFLFKQIQFYGFVLPVILSIFVGYRLRIFRPLLKH